MAKAQRLIQQPMSGRSPDSTRDDLRLHEVLLKDCPSVLVRSPVHQLIADHQ